MSAPRASALVMARAPIPGHCKTALEPLLGPEGSARLHAALLARAVAWAAAAGVAYVAHDPPDAAALVAPHAPGATLFAQADGGGVGERLAAATAHVLAERPGSPLLIVGTDMPLLSPGHAAGALADLEEGVDVVIGPLLEGGYYLLGLARPLPELFAVSAEAWLRPDVLALSLSTAREAGLTVGLLGLERALITPADARAARVDPLVAPGIRALVGPAERRRTPRNWGAGT